MNGSLLASLLLLTAACGDDAAPADPADAGSMLVDVGPPPDECTRPATSCPELQPIPGGPCSGAIECSYVDLNMVDTWAYACTSGAWVATPTCMSRGGCPVPPLAEACREPLAGTVAGASLRIGPSGTGAFRDFTDGERIEPVFGGQGLPMMKLRVEVTGADAVACATLRTQFTMDGMMAPEIPGTLTLRCGRSLDVLVIVPYDLACDERLFDFTLRVSLDGLGTASAHVTAMGGGACTG